MDAILKGALEKLSLSGNGDLLLTQKEAARLLGSKSNNPHVFMQKHYAAGLLKTEDNKIRKKDLQDYIRSIPTS